MAKFLEGFGVVKGFPELVYGQHPDRGVDLGLVTLHDGDAVYVEDFKANEKFDAIKRTGKGKERPGWAPQTGLRTPSWSAVSELRPASLYKFGYSPTTGEVDNDADSDDDTTGDAVSGGFSADAHALPGAAIFLLALGFKIEQDLSVEGDNTGGSEVDAELVMVPDVFAAPSITLEDLVRKYGVSGEQYIKRTLTGCRANGKLACKTGERFTVEITDGGAKTFTREDYVPLDGAGASRALQPDYRDHGVAPLGAAPSAANDPARDERLPLVGLNSATVLSFEDEDGNPVVFDGGLVSFEINMNNNLTYPRTMDEDGSVSEVILAPKEPMSFMLRVEADDIADFDVTDFVANKRKGSWITTLTDRQTGTDSVSIEATIYLEDVQPEEEDSRLVWNLTGTIAYDDQGRPFGSGGSPGTPLLAIRWTTPFVP